jgi:hypothetical protein
MAGRKAEATSPRPLRRKGRKTSFLPNFNNKTTSVAQGIQKNKTSLPNLFNKVMRLFFVQLSAYGGCFVSEIRLQLGFWIASRLVPLPQVAHSSKEQKVKDTLGHFRQAQRT